MTGDNTLIHSHGINRRDFMKLCAALAATMGLSSKAAAEMAESVTNPQRPPVIWIGAQECTGCTESLLRANASNGRKPRTGDYLSGVSRSAFRRLRSSGRREQT
ncbi:hydrogenase-2 small chain [Escherichia coli]|nr:hydrogenase-2 small chain [Escherichia coli]